MTYRSSSSKTLYSEEQPAQAQVLAWCPYPYVDPAIKVQWALQHELQQALQKLYTPEHKWPCMAAYQALHLAQQLNDHAALHYVTTFMKNQ
jgi:hypothetical protein